MLVAPDGPVVVCLRQRRSTPATASSCSGSGEGSEESKETLGTVALRAVELDWLSNQPNPRILNPDSSIDLCTRDTHLFSNRQLYLEFWQSSFDISKRQLLAKVHQAQRAAEAAWGGSLNTKQRATATPKMPGSRDLGVQQERGTS
jgi:hypothetical protein